MGRGETGIQRTREGVGEKEGKEGETRSGILFLIPARLKCRVEKRKKKGWPRLPTFYSSFALQFPTFGDNSGAYMVGLCTCKCEFG